MKTRNIITAIALLGLATFTSCKKNYTCTCTTVVGSASTTETHSIDNVYPAMHPKAVRTTRTRPTIHYRRHYLPPVIPATNPYNTMSFK